MDDLEFLKKQLIALKISKTEEIKEAELRTGTPYPEMTFEQAASDEEFDAWNNKYFGGNQPDILYKNGDIAQEEFCTFALRRALTYLHNMEYELENNSFKGANWALCSFCMADNLMRMYYGIQNGSIALDAAKTRLAAIGGAARIANDPRQKEKSFIFQCWQDWQKSPDTYASKAAFSRDMMTKCEHLKSQKKTEDWCREWEKAHPAG